MVTITFILGCKPVRHDTADTGTPIIASDQAAGNYINIDGRVFITLEHRAEIRILNMTLLLKTLWDLDLHPHPTGIHS